MFDTVVILLVVLAGFVGLGFLLKGSLKELQQPKEDEAFKLMLQMVSELRQEMQGGQRHVAQTIQNQFQQSSTLIQEVTKSLGNIQETNRKVVGFAEQMQSLENILKSPKQRGILGEYALETLLSNHLHGNYEMQYKMKSGEVVDAVIHFNGMVIPIDSKFSLENYNKMVQETDDLRRAELEKAFKTDVKKRIDETSKYIRPQEGTTEFAFMFIPAEGVYYALTHSGPGVIEYAFKNRVVMVSPSSFFAYLQTVIQGMKALEMGENVQQILERVEILGKHILAYDEHFKRLGRHMETAVNSYNAASKELRKIDKDVYRLSGGNAGGSVEILELEKPGVE